MKPNLKELFAKHNINDIQFDSRYIKPGDAFFAIKGETVDGNEYIDDARKQGAKIIFTEDISQLGDDVIYTENIRGLVAEAAGIIYPKLPKKLVSVTGTNGKTSVVSYCAQLAVALGLAAASIGTIGVTGRYGEELTKKYGANLTTADPITFRKILHELASKGIEFVAFEASSHGIHQQRLGRVSVDAAGFTSFSQDHLDYHKDMESYLAAKLQLFSKNLEPGGIAVISSTINYKHKITKYFQDHQIQFTEVGQDGDIKINKTMSTLDGQTIIFKRAEKDYEVTVPIIGSFQAENILVAAELLAGCGIKYDDIAKKLKNVVAVPGRLERVENDLGFSVFIDYAHTPDSLEKSLEELERLKADGALYVLFGSGGNRDSGKRAMMGQVASKIADYVIVTDDNPRHENPAQIRKDILDSTINGKEIAERRQAIEETIEILKKGDILLIAGKGHEDYQIIGSKKYPFSDIKIAKEAIEKCKK